MTLPPLRPAQIFPAFRGGVGAPSLFFATILEFAAGALPSASPRAVPAILATCFLAIAARACQVPVFRYALDRWPADQYTLEVSASDAKDPGISRFLRNFTDSTPINTSPQRSKKSGASSLAFPRAATGAPLTWSGALDSDTLPRIIDSPARTELIRRILAGETGVWLLVEGGDRDANDRTIAALDRRLRYLEKAADIPPIDPDDPTNELGPGPALQVKFSVLPVRRDDSAEQPFLKMLAGPKNKKPPATGPWLALVFGRGRVLGAWPAEGFGDDKIDEACLFLLGACSCQVKRMNPGWDLLLNVDWDERLRAMGYPNTLDTPSKPASAAGPVAVPAVDAIANESAKVETVTFAAPPSLMQAPPAAATMAPVSSAGGGATAAAAAAGLMAVGGFLAWRAKKPPL